MPEHCLIAIDLGASNGRTVIGRFDGSVLRIEVVHRFEHLLQEDGDRRRWDWPTIMNGVREGLVAACERIGDAPVKGVSCCAWGQDFGLLDESGTLFYRPVSYRDHRTDGLPERFSDIISPRSLQQRVGSGVASMTTLCQLRAMAEQEPEALERATHLLWIADLVHHMLCGEAATDWTLATVSQLRNVGSGLWDRDLLDRLGIPTHMLPPIYSTPAILGRVSRERAPHEKLVGVPVVAGVGHDTSAASAALAPLKRGDLYLSAGTWTMLGACTGEFDLPDRPESMSVVAMGLAFGNWGLFSGGMGLWLLQECRRLWEERGESVPDHAALMEAAAASDFESRFDAGDQRFFAPGDMLAEIAAACREAGRPVPQSQAETTRVIFDSLADCFAASVERLAALSGLTFKRLRIIGGGSRNSYLCRKTAQALGLPVVAGLPEATSVGNLLNQALTLGLLLSERQIRRVVEASFDFTFYSPEPCDDP